MEVIDLAKAKKLIRALLISCPRGMPAKDFAADFRNTMGRPLPFQNFGFRTLDDFVRNIPDVVRVSPGPNGEKYYYGVATAETQHVARLVATQKKPPLRSGSKPSACVRPASFTKKGLAGPRARQGNFSGSSFSRRGPPMPPRFNKPPGAGNGQFQSGSYKPFPGQVHPGGHWKVQGLHPYQPPLLPFPLPPSHLHTSSIHYPLTVTRANSFPSHNSNHFPSYTSPSLSHCNVVQHNFPSAMSPAMCSPVFVPHPSHTPVTTWFPFTPPPSHAPPATPRLPPPSHPHPISTSWLSIAPPPGFFVCPSTSTTVAISSTSNRPRVAPPPGYTSTSTPSHPPLHNVVPPPLPPTCSHQSSVTIDNTSSHLQGTHLTISRSNSTPLLHLLPPNSPDPSRAVLLPAGMERHSDTHAAASIKPKQPGARPDTAAATGNQSIKQLSPKGQQNHLTNLSEMVRQLLEEKPNGIWVKRLKKELEAKFKNANIPDDVGTLTMALSFVQTDYPIPSNPIIYMKKAEKQFNGVGVEEGRGNSSDPKVHAAEKAEWPAFNSPTSLTSPPRAKSPAPLPSTVQLDEEFFDVIVTCINSTIDFYVQKSGNEKLLLHWHDDLCAYFAGNVPKVASYVVPNSLYAYLWVDQEARRNYWCRVLVVSCSDQKADVTFPDYGDTKVLPYKDLTELPQQFYTLPFQAVQCSLHGVSDTSEAASLKFMELADQELCVAQVMNSSGHRYALELIPSNAEPGAETINTTILKLSQPISSLKPLLPNPGQPMVPVKLTDVDEDGVLSVQLLGPGLTYLDQLLTEMNNPNSRIRMEGKPMGFVTQRSVGTVCCAPYLDGTWYRAQIKKLVNLKKVLVEYVDFGNEEEVDLNTTMLIIPPPSDLFSLPFQGVKCTLHGLPPDGSSWTEASVEELSGFIELGEISLQVVKKPDNSGLPSVKLFYLSGDDEESQVDIGEHLISQGLFSLPCAGSDPAEPCADDRPLSSPSSSMKIVISGRPGSECTRTVTVVQDGDLGTVQPTRQRSAEKSVQNALPPSCETSSKDVEFPIHSSSGSKPSMDDLVSGMQSLQITPPHSKKTSGSPPLTSLAPLEATPTSPPPLYNITSSPIVTPPLQSGVSLKRRTSPIAQATLVVKVPSGQTAGSSFALSPHTPLSTPPSTPLTSPPIMSPYCGSDPKRRVFGGIDPVVVLVTAVKSPDHFTVQLESEKPQLEVVQQMLEHMKPLPLQGTVSMETFYCAQYNDCKWYRCRVTELLPSQKARVEFVDYGDEMTLNISALHILPQSISGLPVLGITCTLGGVLPLEDRWSNSAVAFFLERVLNKSFFALLKECSPGVVYVALTDTTSLVAKDLVKNGFAKEITSS